MKKPLIYICSPYSIGDIFLNVEKTKGYCKRVIDCGYMPVAPHIYFTQFLNDEIPEERQIGLECGIELLNECDEIWVFGDQITPGMRAEMNHAAMNRITMKFLED